MCGIFGVLAGQPQRQGLPSIRRTLDELFLLSESRGKEAAGLAMLLPESILVLKRDLPASDLIELPEYTAAWEQSGAAIRSGMPFFAMGHARLVTNGAQCVNANNQPVIKDGVVGIHNGIITNVQQLWAGHPELERQSDIDTEVFLALLRRSLRNGQSMAAALRRTYRAIEGVASAGLLFDDLDMVVLSTNNGSLYLWTNPAQDVVVFASERYILRTLTARSSFGRTFGSGTTTQLRAGTACLLGVSPVQLNQISLLTDSTETVPVLVRTSPRHLVDLSPADQPLAEPRGTAAAGGASAAGAFQEAYLRRREAVHRLRRCTCCILPETMPFISFDEKGVCNYCRSYQPNRPKGIEALREAVAPFRKGNGEPECLVTFSGGRDSSFGVHFVKKILELHPVTYTYDWGMVTDLARRNQMRLCGKLGLEHILVSANLAKKRRNIQRNVNAWLRRPDLGLVPLFMAGDKQYFYYANLVGKQTGCKLIVLCENPLEATRFKSGFAGVAPIHDSVNAHWLSLAAKFRIAGYYTSRFLQNPAYLNPSLLDTAWAFACYYAIPHPYLNLYDYIEWDEKQISSTLIGEYNWEVAADTQSTWRIGDGTASFYNHIYYMLGGLTENDTFRSNQIREGKLSRDEALRLATRDNEPRFDSMQWYCDTIGIDFRHALRVISEAPSLADEALAHGSKR